MKKKAIPSDPHHRIECQDGMWLMDTQALTLTWIGELPLPRPSLRQRIGLAKLYIRSSGNGLTFIDWIKRLAKAVAFCLKPAQVSWSGNPMVTTGRSIEEEWANFNLTECVSPHSGQGNFDSLEAKSSSLV